MNTTLRAKARIVHESRVESCYIFDGEFDPGSGPTLAACVTHASRTRGGDPGAWRTGEEHVSNLAFSGGQPAEMRANPAYGRTGRAVRRKPRGAKGGACGRLASWWGNGSPGRRSVAGLRGRAATLGLRTAQTPTGGSSEESSAMGESLTERRRVREDGLRVVNRFSVGREAGRYHRKKPRLTTCQQPR